MAALIERLLIANRGEIATRVARTAHRLGIDTVGVFSEADRGALHTRVVDRAVCIGGASPSQSYLRADAVIEAAVSSGADAVHPGYGFLAENAAFARSVQDAGLVWVGPTPEQIELLGDKVAAKEAAVAAGVPTTEAVVVDPAAMSADLLDELPLPAMVKAAAGGGGRGMRTVHDRSEFPDVVASAAREAEAAFGDGTVFVEPLIEHGRHVEVQVLGDAHGNVVHLGERDCSIQRRHQKVLEEAPSPGISEEVRGALWEGSVALARSVSYRGAGTVEYLVGSDGTIAFLEVNTRLQVEHPVTEAVWGVDLVELQLSVAAGEVLPFSQEELAPRGHAVEARLVAEDPAAGWLPSTGTVGSFSFPDAHLVDGSLPRRPGIRVDSGVDAGSVVGAEYDSLLAKVVAYAPSREGAVAMLGRALRTARLDGVRTNADTLSAICADGRFRDGAATTSYLDDPADLLRCVGPSGEERVVHAIAAAFCLQSARRAADLVTGFAPSGWRNVATRGQRVHLLDADAPDGDLDRSVQLEYMIDHSATGKKGPGSRDRVARVLVGEPPEPDERGVLGADERRCCDVVVSGASSGPVQVDLDGVVSTLDVEVLDGPGGTTRLSVVGASGRTAWTEAPRFVDHDEAAAASGPVSPLPGSVLSVHVSPGDEVAEGDLLVVIEAMKMEHRITAFGDVTIAEVNVSPGDKVDAGDVLVAFG